MAAPIRALEAASLRSVAMRRAKPPLDGSGSPSGGGSLGLLADAGSGAASGNGMPKGQLKKAAKQQSANE